MAFIAMTTILMTAAISPAQLPSLIPSNNSQPLPVGVQRIGNLEIASITLDGRDLFKIATPAVYNRNQPDSLPVEVRAKQVEANLIRLVPDSRSEEAILDPETLEVVIETIDGYPVLFAQDEDLAEPRVLLTTTDADAQYYSLSKEGLAEQWQGILQRELRLAIQLRQPEALRQQVITVVQVLAATTVLSLGLGLAWVLAGRREKDLEQRQGVKSALMRTQGQPLSADPDDELGLGLLQGLQQYLGLRRRLQIVRFLRWLLFWSLAFVWALGLARSLYAFPQTRQYARNLVIVPIVLLVAWFLMSLINRLIDLTVDRFMQNLAQDQSLTPANLQRITTIARVIKGLKMVLVYALGVLWVLQWLNLIPGSVLALGTAIALVMSFAAQSLVRDLVNGFLILLEDQFRIGDFVRIGANAGLQEVSGLVENLNLRITQIRSTEGNLITFANSSIAQVENMSRTWARADFFIEVAYDTDVNQALAIIRDTADAMAQDPEWRSIILDTHELLGVEQLSHTGIMIRLWMKTAPLEQWNVARELRRRLKIAFDRSNIRIGIPQQIWLKNVGSPGHGATAASTIDPIP
jgi:small-conductance mechanosensitive channel